MATAIAVTIIVVFVAAVANAGEFCAASRTNYVIGIDFVIKADGVAASGAFNFDEIVVAAAVTVIIIVAIAAIAFVFVDLVEIFFKSAEIFVNFFNVVFEIFGVFFQTVYRFRDISEHVENGIYNFIVNIQTFSKTFDVCNFFGNVHLCLPTL